MNSYAVIGLGFGDEGKGHVVDYLCSKSEGPTVVVRYCGGPQAAHHVMLEDGRSHVFSHFGSGTFRRAATYWSKYCSMNPIALMNEYDSLITKNLRRNPWITIDPDSPVITPYEIEWNRRSSERANGSCEVGIFATVKREREQYSLHFVDLFYECVLLKKMSILRDYYAFDVNPERLECFFESCKEVRESSFATVGKLEDQSWETMVFEGSQGLLLDQNFGFYPYVTPSNTGTTNITAMGFSPEIWLVTRAYQTRHGNGPMSSIVVPNQIEENPFECNKNDGPQGVFRKTLLDLRLLEYAIYKDPILCSSRSHNIVITCLDLMTKEHRLTWDEEVLQSKDEKDFINRIIQSTTPYEAFVSRNPFCSGISKWEN